MILLLIPVVATVLVLTGGAFFKWSVHVTHTWFPLVPEIPYGTACLSVVVTALGALAMFLLSAWFWSLFD